MANWSKSGLAVASAAGAIILILSACGGGAATATPRPTTAPTATTRPQATATVTVAPTATARPQATATVAVAATATARPQASPTPVPTAQPTTTPTPALAPAFPQAKYGGTLLRDITTTPPGWDSHQVFTNTSQNILQPMFDQLVQMNPYNQSEVIGQIAKSWKASDDGLTWTFALNRGIKFHDGTPLTAQDVKYTYENVILNPPKGIQSVFIGDLAAVATVTAPDDYTVVIKLKETDASFLPGLGHGRMAIFSKAVVESMGREKMNATFPPIGTGPFKGKTYIRGVSAEIVRNTDYWIPGRPFLASQKFFIIPDEGTAYAAFLTGQVNFGGTAGFSWQKIQEMKSRLGDKLTTQSSTNLGFRHIEINSMIKPLDDVRVRQAIGYAVDKMGLATVAMDRAVLGGYLAPSSGWELPDSELKKFPGYDTDLKANVAKAKKLLAEAGYPNGFKTSYMLLSTSSVCGVVAPYVQAQLKDIGITGELQPVDAARRTEIKKAGNLQWQMYPCAQRLGGTDPNAAYRMFHLPGGGGASTGLNDPKLLDLFKAQNAETDPAKRRAKVWEMERYWLDKQGMVWLYYNIIDYAWYSNIKNFQYHANGAANLQFRDAWME